MALTQGNYLGFAGCVIKELIGLETALQFLTASPAVPPQGRGSNQTHKFRSHALSVPLWDT